MKNWDKVSKSKWQEYEAVWQHSQAQGNDLLLLLALAKLRQGSVMYATKETLAELLNCSVDTVDRSLKRLRECGELSWVKGSSHSKRANRYQILLPGLDAVSTAVSPADSSFIPPQVAVLNPRSLPPLNSNETVVKEEISVFDSSFGGLVMMRSCDRVAGVLAPLQVWELLQVFDVSYSCTSAHTEKIRLERWFEYLDKAAKGKE
jgi:hypothetical protein